MLKEFYHVYCHIIGIVVPAVVAIVMLKDFIIPDILRRYRKSNMYKKRCDKIWERFLNLYGLREEDLKGIAKNIEACTISADKIQAGELQEYSEDKKNE